MMASTGWQTEDRGARYVRRARLCVGPGAPHHRLAASMEEALRLAVLPGESQGRVYYFRRLTVAGLPADGDRRVWLDAFQRALIAQAVDAVFGADPRADLAPVIFFRSRQEALEILLHRVIARHVVHEWFWPMVMREAHSSGSSPIAAAASYGVRTIPALVEAIRAAPAAWRAVAAALFAVPRLDVVYLLQAIPVSEAEAWLAGMQAEMDRRQHVAVPVARPSAERRISVPAQRAVDEALRVFGFENARTVWITVLAILHASSAELTDGPVVEQARAVLARLVSNRDAPGADAADRRIETGMIEPATIETGPSGQTGDQTSPRPPDDPAIAPIDHPAGQTTAAGAAPPSRVEPGAIPHETCESPACGPASALSAPKKTIPNSVSEPPALHGARPSPAAPESVTQSQPASVLAAKSVSDDAAAVERNFPPATHPWHIYGLPTHAAGLFFLLNALARIGIEQAIGSGDAAAVPDFVPRILARLAMHSGVVPDDPIALWLASVIGDEPNTAPADRLLRVWVLAVRRWCWRNGKITVREIVARPGIFSVNRTDLDVSLPLEEADVRIRRIGLDLDPGWLPWFGRVVRFHYPYRQELHG